MLRGENIVCGTSTTGTGALTLAACPAAVGGTDPYTAFSGMGLGTSVAVPMPFSIIEFTDSTYVTEKQRQDCMGLLTIGASLTACSLARTTTVNSQASPLPSYAFNPGADINIGTAANTLIFIGASAWLTPACTPWFDATTGDALGVTFRFAGAANASSATIASGTAFWIYGVLETPILLKKMSVRVVNTQNGTTNVYARVYAIGSNGRAGKLLADMGALGGAGTALSSAAMITSAALSTPIFLCPGPYCVELVATISGGTGTPTFRAGTMVPNGGQGTISGATLTYATSTGEGSSASDPASFTSYTAVTANSPPVVIFQNA